MTTAGPVSTALTELAEAHRDDRMFSTVCNDAPAVTIRFADAAARARFIVACAELSALIALAVAGVLAWNWPTPAAEIATTCMRFCVDCPPFCAGAYVPPGE